MQRIILGLFMFLILVGCGENSKGFIVGLDSNVYNTDTQSHTQITDKITSQNCDQVIEKEFSTGRVLRICYDYTYRSARYVEYVLDGALVNDVNLTKRPSFYLESEIPNIYQVSTSDYTNSGYDRGHLAPDASFDYDEGDLKIVYTMANIIPQDPNINAYFWSKAESYARDKAVEFGEITILNGVVFDVNPTYIQNKIAIAKGFWKRLTNQAKGFERCFYYDNFVLFDADKETIDDHEVACNTLL